MIHLDTNVAIALLNNRQPQVRVRFDAARATTALGMSIIVYHELMYGAANSARKQQNQEKVSVFVAAGNFILLALAEEDAREAADIRAHLKRRGEPIGPYDVLIAAQARRTGSTLVTANADEFQRVPGLVVADWSA
jgi:tRNA(fMet)-specific endonuclease VapC